jgi:transmembrane sensor
MKFSRPTTTAGAGSAATHPSGAGIEATASDWVLRREAGLNPAEERELAAWRSADARHDAAYRLLEQTASVFQRAQRTGAATAIITKLEMRARQRRSRRRQTVMALGAVAMLAGAFLFWMQRPSDSAPIVPGAAPLASDLVRKLPDGSIVELNAGAEIRVQYELTVRRVRLVRGEAHFRVEHDATRPFLVQAGGVEVRAVGTAFTVQLQSQAVEVVVTEGRVAVEKTPEPDALAPGVPSAAAAVPPPPPLAFVDAGNRVLVDLAPKPDVTPEIKPMTATQIDERLAWRLPRLEFGGMELAQAVVLMNRYNRLQISLDDPSIRNLRISGVFRADNPEGFVRIVEGSFGLEVERRRENEIILRKAR